MGKIYNKYLIKHLALFIIVALMGKFIPFRGEPIPTWGEWLCDLPMLVIIIFLSSIFHYSNFITHKDEENNKRKNVK